MATSNVFFSSCGNSGPMFCQNAFVIVAMPFFLVAKLQNFTPKKSSLYTKDFSWKKWPKFTRLDFEKKKSNHQMFYNEFQYVVQNIEYANVRQCFQAHFVV
jgi:hypothetical protein